MRMKRLMCNIAGEPGREANARVNSQGYARPEMGSKHVDTRGAALPPTFRSHSGHPTISTSFLFVLLSGMSLATGLSLHIFQF